MKTKLLILLFVLICTNSWLNSYTWHIKQDGTGDFTTIQEGINASVNSDTVLVYPGTYFENIIYNGKNITVASLELTTGDPSYIPLTVINGQQQESCVRVINCESDATIQGFTITNGWGSDYWESDGGGLQIRGVYGQHTFFSIINCRITKNYAESGGGILGFRSDIFLSGTSIYSNSAIINAGGIGIVNTNLTFDDGNRCSIYDNFAGTGLDLYSEHCENIYVIVDTFSTINPTRYFANFYENPLYPNPYTFDILNYSLEQVNHDLYVSMTGDDQNSGLSPDEPMRTIIKAIRKIESDSLNPKTVHLAAGVYSKSSNNQFFAFGGKSNIKIIGESKTSTIIDGENGFHPLFIMGGADNFELKNITFQNIIYRSMVFFIFGVGNTRFENLVLQNYTTEENGSFISSPSGNMYFKNVEIISNSTQGAVAGVYLCESTNVEIIGCKFIDNTNEGGMPSLCAGLQASSSGDIIIENTVFSGNELIATDWTNASALALAGFNGTSGKFAIYNCLFENNQCFGTADKTVLFDCYDDIEINNSTFVDNSSTYTLSLIRNHIDFHNNILRNNCNYEIVLADNTPWGYTSEIDVSYCNIQGGQNAVYNQNNANIVNWGEGNIDVDPLFLLSGDDPYQLTEQSPCIDAGTPDTTGLFIPPWDLLYNERVVDGDGDGIAIIDIGAYEYQDSVSTLEDIIKPITQTKISNYPNPFNPSTTIKLDLAESGQIELAIYNIKGQKVKTLLDCTTSPGIYECVWYGKDETGKSVSSGQYVVNLQQNGKETAKKIMMIK